MQAWTQFYAVIGAAAAALLGLLFVSVSINAPATLGPGHEGSRRFAEQAFHNYIAVIMVSLLALIPDMSLAIFSFSVLAVTALSGVWVLMRFFQTIANPTGREPLRQALRRHVSTIIGFGMMIGAALCMALDWGNDVNVFAAGAMVLLFSATLASWQLLIHIARTDAAPLGGA